MDPGRNQYQAIISSKRRKLHILRKAIPGEAIDTMCGLTLDRDVKWYETFAISSGDIGQLGDFYPCTKKGCLDKILALKLVEPEDLQDASDESD